MARFIEAWQVLAACVIGVSLATCGCASRREVTIGTAPLLYAWVDDGAALAELRARVGAIHTVQGTCEIVMTQHGRSVRLDAALVAKFPDAIRVRAWKMGSAVFDATVKDGAAYVYDVSGEGDAGAMMARGLADLCELLGPTFVEGATVDRGGAGVRLRGVLRDGRIVTCDVDQSTLVIRRFDLGAHIEIALSDHRMFDGITWATTCVLTSATGTVEVRFTDVALNGELSEAALTPPARARLIR